MISLHPVRDPSSIRGLKSAYLDSLIAPMDGMWEAGFANASPHFELCRDGERAGYCAVKDDGALLQFFVSAGHASHARALFDHVIAQDAVKRAVVATVDPLFLALCLDVHHKLTVHSYLYEPGVAVEARHPETPGLDFRAIQAPELDRTVSFQQACLGGDEGSRDWLTAYSTNLIERGELFILCRADDWIGLGELRRSDTQVGVADLGVMVGPAYRKKGWGTYILTRLAADSRVRGLRAICSTTVENVGAQKAIARAGFVSRHRLIDVAW